MATPAGNTVTAQEPQVTAPFAIVPKQEVQAQKLPRLTKDIQIAELCNKIKGEVRRSVEGAFRIADWAEQLAKLVGRTWKARCPELTGVSYDTILNYTKARDIYATLDAAGQQDFLAQGITVAVDRAKSLVRASKPTPKKRATAAPSADAVPGTVELPSGDQELTSSFAHSFLNIIDVVGKAKAKNKRYYLRKSAVANFHGEDAKHLRYLAQFILDNLSE